MSIIGWERTSLHKSEHVTTRERFDTAQVASNYAQCKNTRITRKNQREMQCIETALTGIPPGSLVLDLPTGTGRLLPMLLNRGYQVMAGDYSEHMLTQAKLYCESEIPASERADRLQFARLDVMSTGLPNNSVDVLICNRLLHRYPTSKLRQQALTELARIARQ